MSTSVHEAGKVPNRLEVSGRQIQLEKALASGLAPVILRLLGRSFQAELLTAHLAKEHIYDNLEQLRFKTVGGQKYERDLAAIMMGVSQEPALNKKYRNELLVLSQAKLLANIVNAGEDEFKALLKGQLPELRERDKKLPGKLNRVASVPGQDAKVHFIDQRYPDILINDDGNYMKFKVDVQPDFNTLNSMTFSADEPTARALYRVLLEKAEVANRASMPQTPELVEYVEKRNDNVVEVAQIGRVAVMLRKDKRQAHHYYFSIMMADFDGSLRGPEWEEKAKERRAKALQEQTQEIKKAQVEVVKKKEQEEAELIKKEPELRKFLKPFEPSTIVDKIDKAGFGTAVFDGDFPQSKNTVFVLYGLKEGLKQWYTVEFKDDQGQAIFESDFKHMPSGQMHLIDKQGRFSLTFAFNPEERTVVTVTEKSERTDKRWSEFLKKQLEAPKYMVKDALDDKKHDYEHRLVVLPLSEAVRATITHTAQTQGYNETVFRSQVEQAFIKAMPENIQAAIDDADENGHYLGIEIQEDRQRGVAWRFSPKVEEKTGQLSYQVEYWHIKQPKTK
jgi:hypothetical protein